MTDSIKSALKETIRTTLIAAIGLLLLQVQAGAVDYRALYVAIVIGILRGLERWLHKAAPKNLISRALSIPLI